MKKAWVVGFCLSFMAAFLLMCGATLLWHAHDNASDATDGVDALKSEVDDLNTKVDDLQSQIEDLQSNAN